MATALVRFLPIATAVLLVWFYGVLGHGPLASLSFYGVIFGVIGFGVYCAYTVLSRALSISDAPSAQAELLRQITEVQKDLKAKKIID